MPTGAVPLTDYPHDTELACSKRERRGCYGKASLIIDPRRADPAPDLRNLIAADCPRVRHQIGNDPCGVYCRNLAGERADAKKPH